METVSYMVIRALINQLVRIIKIIQISLIFQPTLQAQILHKIHVPLENKNVKVNVYLMKISAQHFLIILLITLQMEILHKIHVHLVNMNVKVNVFQMKINAQLLFQIKL